MDVDVVTECFGLGRPLGTPTIAATGWGGRNKIWRVATSDGLFAVKDTIDELLPAFPRESFAIECAAHDGGVACAEPIPSSAGASYEQLDGRWYRCHRWVDGASKDNEHTTAGEARRMGLLVAGLHRLAIPVAPPAPTALGERSRWLDLARRQPRAEWARLIEIHIDRITAAETFAAHTAGGDHVGSHCDLNAHNVLFGHDRLVLIDWDAAGPASVSYERASTATLSAQRVDGRLDVDVATAFLRGYRDAGGLVTNDDPLTLPHWLAGLCWWTERNVQIAAAHPSSHHDQLAAGLVTALIAGVETVRTRQRFLAEVIRGL